MIMHSCNANSRIVMQEETSLEQPQVAELSWNGKTKPELIYCTKCTYKLFVRGVGSYATDNIIHLWWIILSHRLHHFFKGEGFRD